MAWGTPKLGGAQPQEWRYSGIRGNLRPAAPQRATPPHPPPELRTTRGQPQPRKANHRQQRQARWPSSRTKRPAPTPPMSESESEDPHDRAELMQTWNNDPSRTTTTTTTEHDLPEQARTATATTDADTTTTPKHHRVPPPQPRPHQQQRQSNRGRDPMTPTSCWTLSKTILESLLERALASPVRRSQTWHTEPVPSCTKPNV